MSNMRNIQTIQNTLEAKTRRWWFFVGLIVLQFLIAPFASKNFDFSKWGDIISYTFGHALFYACKPAFPVFQVIAIAVFLLLPILRNKVRVLLSLHAGLSYVLFAVLQNVAIAPKYGLSIVTINIVMFPLVAATWFWEAVVQRNDFSPRRQPFWKYLVIPPAIFAFWLPINWETGGPGFNPVNLVTSGSALTFCMMTPVYVAALVFFYPRVNMLTLRVTSVVGVIIGLYNVVPKLMFRIYSTWWDGVLHLPLLGLSIAGLILSIKTTKREGHNQSLHPTKKLALFGG
jgi:hypothetical protein